MDYHFVKRGKFKRNEFQSKIIEAKTFLTKYSGENDKIEFNEIRNSTDIGYTIGLTNEYSGNYITYEMKKNHKTVTHLNCFFSLEKDYMEVILL